MRYVGTIKDDVIISKGINYTDYIDPYEIELTEEQYNTIPIPCKLVNDEFIPCEYPKAESFKTVKTPTRQDDVDAMLVEHEYRLTLLEMGVNE